MIYRIEVWWENDIGMLQGVERFNIVPWCDSIFAYELFESPFLYGKRLVESDYGTFDTWMYYLVESGTMSEACRKVEILVQEGF